jgi:hypothetical protein
MSPCSEEGFFRLPIEIRFIIYKQVLVIPRALVVFQNYGCPVRCHPRKKPRRWLALLYTNRQISEEASAVLYGANCFSVADLPSPRHDGGVLKSFLNRIGSVNSALLSRLCMDFPWTERPDGPSGKIKIMGDSMQRLQLLQKKCSNLKILEMVMQGRHSRILVNENSDDIHFAQELLLEIDAQLKEIASLNKIVLEVHSVTPDAWATEFLKKLGWVIL